MYQKLPVEVRESKKEIRPRRLRREGWTPGVVYGKEFGSHPVKFKSDVFRKLLSSQAHIIEITVPGKAEELVNIQEVQRDPISQEVVHVGFHIVKKGEKTEVTVPIQFEGVSPGSKEGGVVVQIMREVTVKCLPKDAPKEVVLDITQLQFESHLTLKDVTLPSGVEVDSESLTDAVATCHAPKAEKEPEPAAEGAAGEGAAEGGDGKSAEGKTE